MHDSINIDDNGLRKANDCFTDTGPIRSPEFLFDEFWREGDLTLMFGPSGAGKSILAVQIAEAVARGRKIPGFQMPDTGSKVLYVDIAFSEDRFRQRYSIHSGREPKSYRFSERLYRDAPAKDIKPQDLGKWLRKKITKIGVRVVIFDSLTALAKTAAGTRETLAIMHELRSICDEMNVSILAISSSLSGGYRSVCEADLMRSRVLCDVADSVFAVGFDPDREHQRKIVQFRSWAAPLKWLPQNAPVALIARSAEDAFLRFSFDGRFAVMHSDEERQLIQEIKWRVDAGAGYREIAEELGISKTRAHRLRKLWAPDMEPPRDADRVVEKAAQIDDFADEPESYRAEIGMDADDDRNDNASDFPDDESTASPMERLAASDHFAAMKRSVNRSGGEIFIEKEDETGTPMVWYGYNKAGRLSRFEKKLFGISITPYQDLAMPP